MKTIRMCTGLLLAMPMLSLADGPAAWRCTQGDTVRRVEIYTEPGVAVPCEVHYYKDTEAPGEPQVLWSAGSDAGFCERKAAEFIGKLQGWGFVCEQGEGQAIESPAIDEEGPDTEAAANEDIEKTAE